MKKLTELTEKFFNGLELLTEQTAQERESDKTCLKKSLEKFLAGGDKADAFVVYFCFSEIFRLFGAGYDNTQKLLELLSDHEYHSGELLSKHRDHYSHSVYVFALGLAIYANDGVYRNAFKDFYAYKDDGSAAFGFLYLWGVSALFHDVGYPFQLAHEQIKSYSHELWGDDKNNPFVSYGNIAPFTAIDADVQERLKKSLRTKRQIKTINELFAFGLKLREGYDEGKVCDNLLTRVLEQPNFMDHGYFSAVILAKNMLARENLTLDKKRLDVLTAILLHNNFNKHDAPGRRPIALEEHPLAYLLTLCDELQNWDRLAYGKVSKRDPIAWDVSLDIRDGEINAEYVFDRCTITDENGKKRMNKSFHEIQEGIFTQKILSYIQSAHALNASALETPKNKKSRLYASDNSFINLCDFAKAIHASYLEYCKDLDADHLNDEFDKIPLEFKVSNIEQAKSYAYKLELINCFYSSKDLDYPVVEDFRRSGVGENGTDNLEFLSREEHVRWVKEKLNMGWKYGTDYKTAQERNAKKIHKDIVPYEQLTEDERKKDELMINNIVPLLRKFGNNVRIYSYRTGKKPDLVIAGFGHRFISGDIQRLKTQIKTELSRYCENYRVIVRTCLGYGADQLIAECACEMGLTTKAVIPTDYEDYIKVVRDDCIACGHEFTEDDELRMRHLLAQTVVCKTVRDPEFFYLGASKYNVDRCNKCIVLWDGFETPLNDEVTGEKINRGGTFDCYKMAQSKLSESDICIIRCQRQ